MSTILFVQVHTSKAERELLSLRNICLSFSKSFSLRRKRSYIEVDLDDLDKDSFDLLCSQLAELAMTIWLITVKAEHGDTVAYELRTQKKRGLDILHYFEIVGTNTED